MNPPQVYIWQNQYNIVKLKKKRKEKKYNIVKLKNKIKKIKKKKTKKKKEKYHTNYICNLKT